MYLATDELRDRLRAEQEQVKADIKKPHRPVPSRQVSTREQDPAVEAIWRLQKHFPLAFPLNPAPKVPLKEGILKDAEQHLELLGISGEQLKQGLSTWCRGSRYWACMTENAPRFDLTGQAVGTVTAAQALHAKQQGKRQRVDARHNQLKPKDPIKTAPDTEIEQGAD